DRLQVILYAVMDLADRRVFRHQLLSLLAEFRDVASEHDPSDARSVSDDRDRTKGDRVAPHIEFNALGDLSLRDEWQRFIRVELALDDLRHDFSEVLSLDLVAVPDARKSRLSVRADELGRAVEAQTHESVGSAR